jgi:hypothetical protein
MRYPLVLLVVVVASAIAGAAGAGKKKGSVLDALHEPEDDAVSTNPEAAPLPSPPPAPSDEDEPAKVTSTCGGVLDEAPPCARPNAAIDCDTTYRVFIDALEMLESILARQPLHDLDTKQLLPRDKLPLLPISKVRAMQARLALTAAREDTFLGWLKLARPHEADVGSLLLELINAMRAELGQRHFRPRHVSPSLLYYYAIPDVTHNATSLSAVAAPNTTSAPTNKRV